MACRYLSVWPCPRGYLALSVIAAGLVTLALPTSAYQKALQGLDLVEDFTGEAIESMKADMVRRQHWCGINMPV